MSPFPASAQVRSTLRRLSEVAAPGLPVLSVYLDLRAHATGQSPGRRASLTVLADRMREIERLYWPRGEDFDSFKADEARIGRFLADELDPAAHGVAIFACQAIGLWETVEAGVPFRDGVSVGDAPDLFQLARLLDQHETAVVALVDSNTARLFVTRTGRLEEAGGPDEDSVSFRRRSMGGWSQARYQRHIDKHITDFARRSAAAIEELVDRESARRIVLAGDEVAITPLWDALSPTVRGRVQDIVRVNMRASRDELADDVRAALERSEAEDGVSVADRVIDAARAGGLGVTGRTRTRRALEAGAVDTLVLLGLAGTPPDTSDAGGGQDARDVSETGDATDADAEGGFDLEERNELVRLAAATDAEIEVVAEHDALGRAGGVGALLRYRPG